VLGASDLPDLVHGFVGHRGGGCGWMEGRKLNADHAEPARACDSESNVMVQDSLRRPILRTAYSVVASVARIARKEYE
jgi:hypothetical protein